MTPVRNGIRLRRFTKKRDLFRASLMNQPIDVFNALNQMVIIEGQTNALIIAAENSALVIKRP